MGNIIVKIGKVREVENVYSKNGSDGMRVRAELNDDKPKKLESIPWAIPLMPKVFHVLPKVGEAVLVITEETNNKQSQRYYIGPIITQPQYMKYNKKEDATSTFKNFEYKPIEKISNFDMARGAFPNNEDVSVIGRGSEDVTLKYDETTKKSEVDIRAGIRTEPSMARESGAIGNIMFNSIDPAYIQLKYKAGLAKNQNHQVSSMINMVADNINLISNRDNNVSDNIHDKDFLVKDEDSDTVMDRLHQVPMGDKLVELLTIMKGAIMNHVHPWAGMEQCGDWPGYISQLEKYDINSILSEYVRIS
jgi:hypothetical protein